MTPLVGILVGSKSDMPVLSTVQMPSGVPVATVAVNGAVNAAVLAAQILALSDENIAQKLEESKA